MSTERDKEISFERMIQRCLVKYRRLFPETPIFYRGAEVVNIKNRQRGVVTSFTLNDVAISHSDGSTSNVRVDNLISTEIYDDMLGALTLASIFYKGTETPAILVSEGSFVLPCPVIFEKYSNILTIPDRERLRGLGRDRYYDHFKKFLKRLSWDNKTPAEIDEMDEADIDNLITRRTILDEETGEDTVLEPELTFEKVTERILDVYKIEPCETCTMPKTCDCRMRIVQQVKGEKAASYRIAQHTIRENAELMSFLLKGVFRGRPRVRWLDYDVFLQERLDQDFDAKWVMVLLNAMRDYENWSGRKVSEEVTTTLHNAVKKLGYETVEELETSLVQ